MPANANRINSFGQKGFLGFEFEVLLFSTSLEIGGSYGFSVIEESNQNSKSLVSSRIWITATASDMLFSVSTSYEIYSNHVM